MVIQCSSFVSSSFHVGFFFIVFQGSRLVFHGSKSVFRVIHGSRLVLRVIHGSRLVFIVPDRFFLVTGGFAWFSMAPGLVFMITGGFLSSLMV